MRHEELIWVYSITQERAASTISADNGEIYQKITAFSIDGSKLLVGSSENQVRAVSN